MSEGEKTISKTRNGALDFIRIVACCGILYLHYRSYLSPGGVFWGNTLITDENSGIDLRCFVEVFFVLSGYLMYPYIEKIREKAGVLDFMRPRLWRFVPMLALGTILYQFLSWRLLRAGENVSYSQSSLWGMIASSFGVQEGWSFINVHMNPEAWFIDVLLLCYLFFYIAVRLGKKTGTDCCWGFAFMVLLGAACVSREWELPFLGYMEGRGYQAFFGGLLLAVWLKNRSCGKMKYFISAVILGIYTLYHFFAPWLLLFGKFYLVAFFVAPALIIVAEAEPVRKLFRGKFFPALGKLTFSTYILHACTLLAIRYFFVLMDFDVDYSHEVMFMAYLIVAFLFGALAYFGLERPLAGIGKKVRNNTDAAK